MDEDGEVDDLDDLSGGGDEEEEEEEEEDGIENLDDDGDDADFWKLHIYFIWIKIIKMGVCSNKNLTFK